ncbi:MAG: DUF4349 domain-containing protein [Oscillospiraceae bacterium]|nr:DUF4349 domain-containing protein [Oscillospiraceae bacterium]
MKGKKLLALLLALLVTGAVLAGCGAKSESTAAYDMASNQEAPMAEAGEEEAKTLYSTTDSAAGTPESATDQKLIKRVSINAETEDLDPLLENLNQKIAELGGYIEYQDIYNGSSYSSYRYRSASMTIRIPADKLDGFVEQVKGASNVVSVNQSQENVTLTYVATESRMKALETEQERLLELMEQAQTMSDLLEIEARLTEVRSELESVTSQLRVLSNQVDYATVELYIDQVRVYTEVEEQTVWQRIGSGFQKNLKNIGEELVDFFVWVVTYSPQLLILAAAAAVVIVLVKRSAKKRRARKNAMPPFEAPPQQEEQK